MKNLLALFIKDLESSMRIKSQDVSILRTYGHLFEILELVQPDALDYVYDDWLQEQKKTKEKEKGTWFWSFHKSMRQCDLFIGVSVPIRTEHNLDEEEENHYQKLRKQYIDSRKILNNYEWCSNEYYMADAKWKIDNKELRSEYAKLSIKRDPEDIKSVGGHLDMILWNLIHVDKEGVLYKSLDEFFKEMKEDLIKEL